MYTSTATDNWAVSTVLQINGLAWPSAWNFDPANFSRVQLYRKKDRGGGNKHTLLGAFTFLSQVICLGPVRLPVRNPISIDCLLVTDDWNYNTYSAGLIKFLANRKLVWRKVRYWSLMKKSYNASDKSALQGQLILRLGKDRYFWTTTFLVVGLTLG